MELDYLSEKIRITEIFHSIQGESSFAGYRTSFIRLTGCPLRCEYCDTKYSYTGGAWKTVKEILGEIKSHGTQNVCITGGEPLAQKKCIHLARALFEENLTITIETDGEEEIEAYQKYARIIMDIKTPSSKQNVSVFRKNIPFLRSIDEVKFIIGDRKDYEWAKSILYEYQLTTRAHVLFSPSYEKVSLKDLAEWILSDKLDVRLQTQLHKHIWGKETTGV